MVEPRQCFRTATRGARWSLACFATILLLVSQGVESPRIAAQGQSVLEGTLEVHYEDSNAGARLTHYLNTGTERIALRFGRNPPRHLLTGDRVRARGARRNGMLMLDTGADVSALSADGSSPGLGVPPLDVLPLGGSGSSTVPLASPFTFGAQSTLVILFNFTDLVTQPYTTASAQAATFTDVNNFDLETSFGQTWLTGTVTGWYTIASPSTSCDYTTWATQAEEAATAAGVDLNLYPRRVFGFPQTAACSWWGLGTVGGGTIFNPSRAWINGPYSLRVVGHEMGHNFGLYHARSNTCDAGGCVVTEYGDDHDIMGGVTGHFSAFQKERLGWLGYGTSPTIQGVTAVGQYPIEPYATPNGGLPKALRILKSTTGSSNTYIYAEARTQYGADAALAPGVLIHTGVDTDGSQIYLEDLQPATSVTDFILDPGQSFTFTDVVPNITLTTMSFDATGAVIAVTQGCAASLASSSQSFASAGGPGSVALTTGTGCGWTATSDSAWLTLNGGSTGGTGPATIQFTVAANGSASARTGTLTIGGQTFTVTQAGASCIYTVLPTSPAFNYTGSPGSTVSVTSPGGCTWTATSNASWLTITAGASGTGNGSVTYSVASNSGSHVGRSGTLTIAGQTVTVTQDGLAALFTQPSNGSTTVANPSLTFLWTDVGAQRYQLTVGTTPGGVELLDTGEILQATYSVTNLPASTLLYARLRSKFTTPSNPTWTQSDISFTTVDHVSSVQVLGAQTPSPVVAGQSTQYGANVGTSVKVMFTGSLGTCTTAALSATGLPSGASATFAPSSVTSSASTVFSLLTIATTGLTPPGSYTVTVTAQGSGACSTSPVTTTVPLIVAGSSAATTLSSAAASGPYGGSSILSATLRASGSPVSGKTIAFTLNGSAAGTAVTNASGVATLASASLAGISAGSYPTGVGASFAGDTSYVASSGTNALTVGQKSLTPTVVVGNKVYDGGLSATITSCTLPSGVVGGDVVSCTGGSAAFVTNSVGAGKPVTVTGLGLTGTAAGNYTLAAPAPVTAAITAAALTPAVVVANKVYDGGLSATITSCTLPSGVASGDVGLVSCTGGSAVFVTNSVGAGKPVTVTGLGLTGTAAGNYTLAAPAPVTAAITAAALTPAVVVANKVYDGGLSATISSCTLPSGVASGDVGLVSCTGGSAVFVTNSVGAGKPVTVTGLGLTGTAAGNYTLAAPAPVTAAITAVALPPAVVVANKVYDGGLSATISSCTLPSGVASGDVGLVSCTGGSAVFVTNSVGAGKPVTVTGLGLTGTAAGNYTLAAPAPVTAAITAVSVTATVTAGNKVYDRTVSATLTSCPLTGVLSGDVVSCTGTAAFATASVGAGKTVTVNGLTLTGAAAGNYTLATTTATTTATISAVSVTATVTAANKVFDGTTSASLTSCTLTGVLGGDVVSCTGTATFDTATVGVGKTVTVTGLTLTGAQAGNYVLAATTTTTTAAITAAGGPTPVVAYGFNEGTGTTTANAAGPGSAGSLTNATWAAAGKYGGALTFNGTSALVSVPDTAALHLTTAMTLEAWVKPASTVNGYWDVIYKGNDNYFLEATPSVGGTFGSTDVETAGPTPLSANTWAYLAATYDGATLRLYVNGTQVASVARTGTLASSSNPLQIGGDSLYGQYFQGTIDEVRVYNVALTAAQIQSDMTTPIGAGTPGPDLTVTATHAGGFTQGQTGATYTVTVNNAGTGATSGLVTVVDTLPGGLTATGLSGTGWSCTVGTGTCTRSDALAAGASYPAVTVTMTVASNAPASVTNQVTVSGGGETTTANDSASDVTAIAPVADLTVTATHAGGFTQGQTGATYTVTVNNAGPGATSGLVTVVDTLPGGLTATGLSGTGWSCTVGTLTCTRSTALAAGASYPAVTVTVTVAGTAPASVTNQVTVSGGGELTTANDSASDVTAITPVADLTVTATHAGVFTQGQTGATYTVTVSNAGPGATNGLVTLVDTLPGGLTATGLSGTGWSCTVGTLTCTRSTALAAGASYPAVTVTVTVASTAPASVTNQVTVSGGGELTTANDSASDPTAITPVTTLMTVTATVTAANKVYDGATSATLTSCTLGGVIAGDVVTCTGGTATFASASVGVGQTVTVSGLTLTGAQAGNYTLASPTATTTAAITAVTITPTVAAANKVYDRTVSATLTSCTLGGVIGADVVSCLAGTATFDTASVGVSKTVTVSGLTLTGAQAGNYTLGSPTATTTAAITAVTITPTVAAANKVYDGATSATLTSCTLGGVIGADVVSCSAGTATFDTASVGVSKTVTVSGLTLTGAQAANYTLASTTATTTAAISAISLTPAVAAADKGYDGTTNATLTSCTLSGVIGADVVSCVGGTASFATASVGAGKPVTVSGLSLTGAAAGNYTLAAPAPVTAAITAVALPPAVVVANKVYDGGLSATISSCTLPSGVASGDVGLVSCTGGTAVFVTNSVGAGKAVTVTGLGLTGTAAGNYTLAAPAPVTAAITAVTVTATVTAGNKVYDRTVSATLTSCPLTGVLGGDVVSCTGVATFATASVGVGKPVTVNGLTLTGAAAGNYTLATTTAATTAAITAVSVTATVAAANKVFDGTTSATLTSCTLTGVLGGDVVSCTGTATFDTATVGVGKTVTVTGLTLTGAQAGNYVLAATTATTTAAITTAASPTPVVAYAFNEGTGTTTANGAGPGSAGSLTNATWTAAGKYGGALTFNGTSALVSVPDTAALHLTAAMTLEAWVKPASTVNGYWDVIYKGNDNYFLEATPSVGGTFGSSDVERAGPTPLSANTWAYLAATYDGATLRLYVNGTQVTSAARTGTLASSSNPLQIGGDNLYGQYFQGTIDEVRVYNVALTAAQIQSDMTTPIGTGTPGPDLTVTATHAGGFTQGQTGATYTVTVNNAGTGATSGLVTVVDTLPGGLTATGLSGTGWSCTVGTGTCTRSDALAAGASYPAVTVTMTVASNAPASVTNQVTVSGGGETTTANDSASDVTAIAPVADLTVTATHAGGFTQGQTGATYTVTVNNAGPGATSGLVTVVDTLPGGLTATGLSGTGWSCTVGTLTCTRSTALAAGASYPAVTVTVTVAGTAPASVTNQVTVSGGGELTTANDSASDVTAITPVTAPMAVTATVTAANKVYDRTVSATLTSCTLTGVVGGDVVSCTGGTATFASAAVGVGQTVTVSGLTLTGAQAGNYTLASTTATTTAAISAVSLAPTVAAANKVYDRTVSATLTSCTLGGVIAGDVVTCAGGTATFASASVGVGQTVTVSGLTLTGAQAGNYTLASTTATTTAAISAVSLAPTVAAANKVYDRTVSATLTSCTLAGVIAGDVVSCSGSTATFDTPSVGVSKTVTVNGLTLTGAQATNYTLASTTATTTAAITAVTITPTVAAANKVYDGATSATLTSCALSGVIGGDVVNCMWGTAAFASAGAGVGKTVTVSGLTLTGAQAGNYTLASTTATTTAAITVVTVSSTVAVADKVFDGTTSATLTSCTLTGVIGADVVSCTGTATFDTASVGVGKTVTVSGLILTGAAAGNYVLSTTTATTTAAITAVAPADLTVTKTHGGSFTQGQTGATYTVTVHNAGTGPTSGTVTVVDTLPGGLTATALSGTGWSCTVGTGTCTRSDALAAGASYPAVTVTVTVAGTAPASVTNQVTVSGGGETNTANDSASDLTTITPAFADLTVTKTHVGGFTQGQTGTYTVTVRNAGTGPTSGTVTVVDTLPGGLTATALSGTGWSCTVGTGTCTRSTALAAGASYPAVTVTVSVASNAPASVTNQVTVSGGGETNTANDSASDPTTITPPLFGLVAAYAFNEGTGTTTANSSGPASAGSLTNAAWTAAGKYGGALTFNGTSALVSVPDTAALHLTTAMTLEAWVKPASTVNGYWDVIYKGNDNYFLEATPSVGGTFGSSDVETVGPTALSVNTWAYLAATYDGATLRLYVNGTQVASAARTGTLATSSNPLQIGGDNLYGQYFQGTIDEVRVYNVALTVNQIQSDMNTPISVGP